MVVDTPGWFDGFAERLAETIVASGGQAKILRDCRAIEPGGVAFFLSCLKIVPPEILRRSALNAVAHASALPQGRGFSPAVWQILDGANVVPVSIIEAVDQVDAGDILLRSEIVLQGHELNSEIRSALGETIVSMCLDLLARNVIEAHRQTGEPSWYPRRHPDDSRIDPRLSLIEQFELLRVVDNDRYPAFFEHRGHRYELRIDKAGVAR